MLPRALEAELMDDAAARAYDALDHGPANRAFVADLLRDWDGRGPVLDVGCGPGHIAIAVARAAPGVRVVALDASPAMLTLARRHAASAGLADRVALVHGRAQALGFAGGAFGALLCNGTLHHVPEPGPALAEVARVTRPGGRIFVRDLFRPPDEAAISRLVDAHAGDADDLQRRLFADSFRAALTAGETRDLVAALGFAPETVRVTSDRHWTWSAAAPGGRS